MLWRKNSRIPSAFGFSWGCGGFLFWLKSRIPKSKSRIPKKKSRIS